jgi:hypothetical protein
MTSKFEYHIIQTFRSEWDTSEFEHRVVMHLERGWELVGGVSMAYVGGNVKFSQAVKREAKVNNV